MSLLNLPAEILISICKQLDVVSLFNLYRTCGRLRQIIASHRIVKICNLSMSPLTTGNTLRSSFYKDISTNLQELNLCGITDLNKKTLISGFMRLKCLKTLNISFTNIHIFNFIKIHRACPSIENLTISYMFFNNNQRKLATEKLKQCQNAFKNMESVHFVGSDINLLYSQIPFFILNKSKLKILQYTISNYKKVNYDNECENTLLLLLFDEFCLDIMDEFNLNGSHGFFIEMFVLRLLDFKDYEVIILYKLADTMKVYATPMFKDFFDQRFQLKAESIDNLEATLSCEGSVVMLWSKRIVSLNDAYFNKLWKKLRTLIPYHFRPTVHDAVSPDYDWYCTVPTEDASCRFVSETGIKRQRIVQPNYVLNYDDQFRNESQLELCLDFNGQIKSGVTLSTDSDYLRKLTYLNLYGVVRYSSDFFNILFQSCNQLITLNVEAPTICPCYASISKSIALSQSLKNIRLVDRRINFELMFSSMSQCKSLENINICDNSSDTFDLSDPFIMFKNCKNLYCLYVYGPGTKATRSNKLKLIKLAKAKSQKPFLKVEVFSNSEFCCDPYVAVFQSNVKRLIY